MWEISIHCWWHRLQKHMEAIRGKVNGDRGCRQHICGAWLDKSNNRSWNLKEAESSEVSGIYLRMRKFEHESNPKKTKSMMLWWGCGSAEQRYDTLEGYITKARVRFPDKIPPLLRGAASSVWRKNLTGSKQLWLGSRGLCVWVGSTGSFFGAMKALRTCPVLTDLLTFMGFSYHLLKKMQSILIDVNFC